MVLFSIDSLLIDNTLLFSLKMQKLIRFVKVYWQLARGTKKLPDSMTLILENKTGNSAKMKQGKVATCLYKVSFLKLWPVASLEPP